MKGIALLATLAASAAAPAIARADVGGRVVLVGLTASERWGGGLLGDTGYAIGDLRVGAGLGAIAITAADDDLTASFMPVTISAAWAPRWGDLVLDVRGRAGLWSGATNQGLRASGLLGGELAVGWAIGPEAALVLGGGVWRFLGIDPNDSDGHDALTAGTLFVGLAWSPRRPDDA